MSAYNCWWCDRPIDLFASTDRFVSSIWVKKVSLWRDFCSDECLNDYKRTPEIEDTTTLDQILQDYCARNKEKK